MDDDIRKTMLVLSGIEKPETPPPPKSTNERNIAYLKSKLPESTDSQIDMLYTMLVIMDTKSVVGVNIFEEQPEDFNAFMEQYKLWDILKS